MNSYWRWKCEECGYEFILALVRLPMPCHRCGGEWFLKVGEAATKPSVFEGSLVDLLVAPVRRTIDRFPAENRHPAPLQTNQVLDTESQPIHSIQYFPAQFPKRVRDLWVIERVAAPHTFREDRFAIGQGLVWARMTPSVVIALAPLPVRNKEHDNAGAPRHLD